eukprot:SAG11_NODE_6_length_32111_cov_33.703174_5_plen_346_part_00
MLLDPAGMGRVHFYLNGVNLGRHYPASQGAVTAGLGGMLCLPRCLLKDTNVLVLGEDLGATQPTAMRMMLSTLVPPPSGPSKGLLVAKAEGADIIPPQLPSSSTVRLATDDHVGEITEKVGLRLYNSPFRPEDLNIFRPPPFVDYTIFKDNRADVTVLNVQLGCAGHIPCVDLSELWRLTERGYESHPKTCAIASSSLPRLSYPTFAVSALKLDDTLAAAGITRHGKDHPSESVQIEQESDSGVLHFNATSSRDNDSNRYAKTCGSSQRSLVIEAALGRKKLLNFTWYNGNVNCGWLVECPHTAQTDTVAPIHFVLATPSPHDCCRCPYRAALRDNWLWLLPWTE